MKKKYSARLPYLLFASLVVALLSWPTAAPAADTARTLERSFNEICSQTTKAETLSVNKLEKLISQCDRLEKKIANSHHPRRKVLLFRLKKCRKFFIFMLECKSNQTEHR